MFCYDNPFRKVIKKLKIEYENRIGLTKEEKEKKEKERWIEDQKQAFKIEEKRKIETHEINGEKKQNDVKSRVLTQGFY